MRAGLSVLAALTIASAGTPVTTTQDVDDADGGFDLGWLGLLGLERKHDHVHHDTTRRR